MSLYAFLLFLSLFGLLNGFLIAAILFFRPGKNNLLSRLIALLFFSGALAMLLITLVNARIIQEYPIISTVEYFIALGVGPLLFIGVRLFTQPEKPIQKVAILHFVPAFAFLFYTLINPTVKLPVLAFMLHFQTYIAGSTYAFLRHAGTRKQNLWKKQKFWMTSILSFYVLIGLSQWVRFIFSDTQLLNLIIPLTASLNFHIFLLLGFSRSPVLPRNRRALPHPDKQADNWEAIERVILQQKLFTQKGLTINQLADQLQLPAHQFSALLRQQDNQHFPNYINTLRVNYAKLLLHDPAFAHYTIEAIAHEAGFQSRSAFYQCFKKQTGLTPSVLRIHCPDSGNTDK